MRVGGGGGAEGCNLKHGTRGEKESVGGERGGEGGHLVCCNATEARKRGGMKIMP